MTQDDFAIQYTQHFNNTCKFLNKLTNNSQETEEIAQWSWAKAWEKRHQFTGINNASFPTWVVTIAANHYKGTKRGIKAKVDQLPQNFDTKAPFLDINTKLMIQKIIRILTRAEQHLFFDFYYNGMSIKELSFHYQVPEVTCRIHLFRARRKLKIRLGQ